MGGGCNLVIGASGFLGSHVTHRLVERGASVRVMLRPTSSTKAIDDFERRQALRRHFRHQSAA
jgi:dihydroflavonol-4-reductase